MGIYNTNSAITAIKHIGSEINAVYHMGVKVWPDAPVDEIVIGTQTWKIRNLDIDDGNGGIYASDASEYGRLYTYAAAVRVAATVPGFHLPSDSEWMTLCNYLGGLSVAGNKLKEAGAIHWSSFNTATNSSGFSAVGAGLYVTFVQNVKVDARFWTNTPVNTTSTYAYIMKATTLTVIRGGQTNTWGLSIRLIKD